MGEKNRRFTVALSFPGERREYISRVAARLAERLGKPKVLFDSYHEAEFARPNLDLHLPNLYRTESELIAIFLCDEYEEKRWCNLEWRFIRQLIQTADEDRIMFFSFDEIAAAPEIGILAGDGYVSIGRRSPEEIAELIFDRLGQKGLAPQLSRVCFVSSEYPPRVSGGLGVHVNELTLALSKHLNVDMVLPNPAKYPDNARYQDLSPRIRVFALTNDRPSYDDPISWLHFANYAADRIMRTAVEFRPDVIHCHDWVTVLAGIICRYRLNIPLVFHLHLPNKNQLCASVENLGLVCADLVTVNSEFMYAELKGRKLNNYLLPLKRVEIVKNGVDTNRFVPCEDWPADDGYVLFVGRLVEQKGVEYLLRAFYYVREKFPHIRLKIVGDGAFRPMLERLCTNLILSGEVEFLGWKMGQDLVQLYQKAQVVTIPSIYEPFGMTALEALACQRPVVAARVGGLQEIVQPGVTGFLADPKDDLDLARWIMTLLANPELRNKMGEVGRAYVLSNGYTWPQIADHFLQMYWSLLRQPVVRDRPDEVETLRRQIENVARKVPSIGGGVLEQLFYWEPRS